MEHLSFPKGQDAHEESYVPRIMTFKANNEEYIGPHSGSDDSVSDEECPSTVEIRNSRRYFSKDETDPPTLGTESISSPTPPGILTPWIHNPPRWMMVSCAFLLAALIGMAFWSRMIVSDLRAQAKACETRIQSASACPSTWISLGICQTDLVASQNHVEQMADQYNSCNLERNDLKVTLFPDMDNQIKTLETKVIELENSRDDLNVAKICLEKDLLGLNNDVLALKNINADLKQEVNQLQMSNINLSYSEHDLSDQVASLSSLVNYFDSENQSLEQNVRDLNGEITTLQRTRSQLQQDVVDLQQESGRLSDHASRLEVQVGQLKEVSSYIENSSVTLHEAYDKLLGDLARQISLARELALRQMQNYYADAVHSWDCSVYDGFGGAEWLFNRTMNIPEIDFNELVDLVERKVLNALCLNRGDFEAYLLDRYGGLDSVTWSNFIEGTIRYSEDARAYYFPLSGNPGLSEKEWEAADYNCRTVPPFRKTNST